MPLNGSRTEDRAATHKAPLRAPQELVPFTGKEWCKSQWLAQRGLVRGFSETGYSYFGARYMDHELMTMWLSVDPMAEKYPRISP